MCVAHARQHPLFGRGDTRAPQPLMAYLFDTTGVSRLLDDAAQLQRDASAQERQLTALVAPIEHPDALGSIRQSPTGPAITGSAPRRSSRS